MRKFGLLLAPLFLAACAQTLSERKEEGMMPMTSQEISAYFSEERTGTFTNPDGTTGKLVYSPDGTSYVKVGSNYETTGNWRVGDDKFCAEWEDREEMCFTMVQVGPDKFEVYNADGTLRSVLNYGG